MENGLLVLLRVVVVLELVHERKIPLLQMAVLHVVAQPQRRYLALLQDAQVVNIESCTTMN